MSCSSVFFLFRLQQAYEIILECAHTLLNVEV